MSDTLASVQQYLSDVAEVTRNLSADEVNKAVEILLDAYENGKVVYTMGNGGHGSTASHFANDITKHPMVSDNKDKIQVTGKRTRALSMCDNPFKITEWGNDMGFGHVLPGKRLVVQCAVAVQKPLARLIERLAALLEPAAIIGLAVLIAFVVMAAILPILRLQEIL